MAGIIGLIERGDARAVRSRAEAMLSALPGPPLETPAEPDPVDSYALPDPDDPADPASSATAHGLYVTAAGRGGRNPSSSGGPFSAWAPAGMPSPLHIALGHRPSGAAGEAADRAAGRHQPVPAADGMVWAVMDGKLTGSAALRDDLRRLGFRFREGSDAETVANAYLAWGADCVRHLSGEFALAVYDARERSLFLARDAFGVRPLVWHWQPSAGRLMFASEPAALLAHPSVPRRLDEGAAYRFLVLDIADADSATFFEGISNLPPGGRMRVRLPADAVSGGPQAEQDRWFRPTANHEIALLSAPERAELFARTLSEAVRSRLDEGQTASGAEPAPPGSPPVAAELLLSGGTASGSLLAGLMAAGPAVRVRAWTAAEPEAPEAARRARAWASAAGADLREAPPGPPDTPESFAELVRRQQEPFPADGLLAASSLRSALAAAASAGAGAALAGTGADELLGPARWSRGFACADHLRGGRIGPLLTELREWLKRDPSWWRRLPLGLVPRNWRHAMIEGGRQHPWLGYSFLARHRGLRWPAPDFGPVHPGGSLADECLWAVGVSPLPGRLRRLARLSAGAGLEVRLPFLDAKVVASAAGLPTEDRVLAGRTRPILRLPPLMPQTPQTPQTAAADPTDPTNPPSARVSGAFPGWGDLDGPPRRKVPEPSPALAGMFDDLFDSSDVADAGPFEPATLRRVWRDIRSGRRPMSPEPWKWASFLLWRRMFLSPGGLR
jgi:asparagine synthase (glutamine-hydrolysing)